MIPTDGLARTLDALNEAIFTHRPLPEGEKQQAGECILARQYPGGPYAGLLAPSQEELAEGFTLFTGEKLHTQLGPRNVLSAEAGTAILRLGLASPSIHAALERLRRSLLATCFAAERCVVGECAHSGLAFMRFLSAGGTGDAEERLREHIRVIHQRRDGKGRWSRFPCHYTLLVLAESGLPEALGELRYAARALERSLKRQAPADERHTLRRRQLAERVLAKC